MKNKNFNYYIANFFKEYLPNVVGVSQNTISSYRDTFVLFFYYLKEKHNLNINLLKFDDITCNEVNGFLSYLESERKNSINTRNQRLAAIHSFYKYLQKKELSYYNLFADILSIPIKKAPENTISYFSKDELTIFINSIDTTRKDSFRDYVLFMLFYETGARVSEISNLKRTQLNINRDCSSVILIGKGNKQRNNPISQELSSTISKYINVFKISEDDYLFKSKFNKKITSKGIAYLFDKYINLSKTKYPNLFKKNYSTHSIRHSRATHLLEDGVPIEYIKDILGHKNLETTYIYAEISPKVKEQQILKNSENINANDKFTESEKEALIDFLKTL